MVQEHLKGKVALITGGTTGIGMAAAKLFLKNGVKVVIAGRRKEQGDTALTELKEISRDIHFIPTDVSKSEEVKTLLLKLSAFLADLILLLIMQVLRGILHQLTKHPKKNLTPL